MKKSILLVLILISGMNRGFAQELAASLTELLPSLASGSILLELANELTSNSFPVVSGLGSGGGGSLDGLISLGSSTLLEPQGFFANLAALGLPLAGEYSPALGVLINSPESAFDALVGGSASILSPGIAAIPEIPLVTAPLAIGN